MANILITPTILSQWDDHLLEGFKQDVFISSVLSVSSQDWSHPADFFGSYSGSRISSLGFKLPNKVLIVADYLDPDNLFDIDWYIILPTQYHTNPLNLSSFLFSSHSQFVNLSSEFYFYYIGDANTILVTEYGDQSLNIPVTVEECFYCNSGSDTFIPTNIHRCSVTLSADKHYTFSDGVKTVDLCTYQGSQPGFTFINKFGSLDFFNFIEKSESSRSISYDSIKVSSFQQSVSKFINYNPKDESKTTFTTKVLKPQDQSQFSELISSPWVVYNSCQVLVDKSSISRSSKAQSYSFSIQGVL